MYFVSGVFSISEWAGRLKAEAAARGGDFRLVIVDTGPAFFEGESENDRTQMGDHARMLRDLITTIPGKPAVVANVHPTKNAGSDNLLPAGGGNFLNEVDGNLTAAKTDSTTEVHWQGKFRGVEFAPLHFLIKTVTHERLKDKKGRLMPTVICDAITELAQEQITKQSLNDQNRMLTLIDENPKASQADLAAKMGWTLYSGAPHKTKATRCVEALIAAKLVKQTRAGIYQITGAGRAALEDSAGA